MKNAATQELYAYWNSLRGARPAPRRSEVDPVAIPHSLADIFLLELQDDGRIAIRLAGTRLCDLYGRELRGSSAASLWAPPSRREIDEVVRCVLDEAAVAVIAASAGWDGRHAGGFELVATPLADAGGTCRYVIGALTPGDQAARDAHRIDALELGGARLSWPSGLRRPSASLRDASPAEEPRRIGRFMVYDGGLELAEPEASTPR